MNKTLNSYGKPTAAAQKNMTDKHLRLIFWLGILLRILVAFLALLASYLPAFDSSADILLEDASRSFWKRWISTCFRWDAFHFLHVADQSYKFEHEWAFFPGVPFISRISGWVLSLAWPYTPSIYLMLLGQYILSVFLTPTTARVLYVLTLQHTASPNLALLSACLSLLPSSPATLALAPYAEPWFALFSYEGLISILCYMFLIMNFLRKGMSNCTQKRWLRASGYFCLASMFRANGIFLGGFIFWGMIVEPLMTQRRITLPAVFRCIMLSLLPALPFIGVQATGYKIFCTYRPSLNPSWCNHRLPLIYGHVQSHYWNVGFLRYWTLQQVPNFLLAAPPLLLLLYSSLTHILHTLSSMLRSPSKFEAAPHRLLAPSILPHAIHALIITCTLLFASHTQIILRLASSMPFTYWSAARLFDEHPKWARAWVLWSVIWGATSVVLWTTFLPPA